MAIRPPWAARFPNAPFIYFAARAGTYAADSTQSAPWQQFQISTGTGTGLVMPYIDARVPVASGAAPTYINPQTFQILCPGLDGKYGFGQYFPTGNPPAGITGPGYTIPDQMDDITNFTRGKIEDEMN